jgi:glycosyltransferase involved in cell wall biosynthesis
MHKSEKPVVVVSGVNLVDMGAFSIFVDCLRYLSTRVDEYRVIALVHKASLFDIAGIEYLSFPKAKLNILLRLYHEYVLFRKLSRRLKPELWLSIHNFTPNAEARKMAVYLHNPANLYKPTIQESMFEPTFALKHIFLDLLYSINIHKNDVVIVQQDWIRTEFKRRFKLDNVIVAHPTIKNVIPFKERVDIDKRVFRFFYPSYPSVYKNYEVVRDAVRILRQKEVSGFEVIFNFSAETNRYGKFMVESSRDLPEIHFVGRMPSREDVFEMFGNTDCLIFASRLETWGLPISEFKASGRPMLIANANYARETVGEYDDVAFFSPDSPEELARLMSDLMQGGGGLQQVKARPIAPPFARDWPELFDHLLLM